jgi:hypothetical protein
MLSKEGIEAIILLLGGASSFKVPYVCVEKNVANSWRYSIQEDKWLETGRMRERRWAAFAFHEAAGRNTRYSQHCCLII